jgi:hypothetical protein
MLPDNVIQFSGWLPAIIIPVATALQLIDMLRKGSAEGVSALVWFLFGIANLGLYVYTEKYLEIQAVLGLLGTAVIDFVITGMAVGGYGRKRPAE